MRSPTSSTTTRPAAPAIPIPLLARDRHGSVARRTDGTLRTLRRLRGAAYLDLWQPFPGDRRAGRLRSGLAGPLADGTSAIGAELVWSIENEMALGLSDAVIRRAMAAWTTDLGRSAAEGAARIGQSHLGWTKDRAADELAEFDNYIERFRGTEQR